MNRRNMHKLRHIIVLLLSMLFITACDPVYVTKYHYNKESATSSCIADCAVKEQNCRSQQDTDYRMCETTAAIEYASCRATRYCYHDRGGYRCDDSYCIRRNCYADYSPCVNIYNICFEGCGGRVTPYQVCVSNCEKEK